MCDRVASVISARVREGRECYRSGAPFRAAADRINKQEATERGTAESAAEKRVRGEEHGGRADMAALWGLSLSGMCVR